MLGASDRFIPKQREDGVWTVDDQSGGPIKTWCTVENTGNDSYIAFRIAEALNAQAE